MRPNRIVVNDLPCFVSLNLGMGWVGLKVSRRGMVGVSEIQLGGMLDKVIFSMNTIQARIVSISKEARGDGYKVRRKTREDYGDSQSGKGLTPDPVGSFIIPLLIRPLSSSLSALSAILHA